MSSKRHPQDSHRRSLEIQHRAKDIVLDLSISVESSRLWNSKTTIVVASSSSSLATVADMTDYEVSGAAIVVWTRLQDIRNRLKLERSNNGGQLTPCDDVNRAFTDLVNLCVHTASPVEDRMFADRCAGDVDVDELMQELREYAAEGESHLEKYWARKLIAKNRPLNGPASKVSRLFAGLFRHPFHRPRYPIETFVYYDNYVHLTRLELAALRSVMPLSSHHSSVSRCPRRCCSSSKPLKDSGLRLAFIGSGPMPLSSLEIGNQASDIVHIHNIDSDAEAIRLSIELSGIFGFGSRNRTRYTFECSDIRSVTSLQDYDIVYVASLVGTNDSEKDEILSHLNRIMRVGAHLVVRSVRGLRELLYPKVTMAQIRLAGFAELLQTHPYGGNGVVNSVVIAVKPGTKNTCG